MKKSPNIILLLLSILTFLQCTNKPKGEVYYIKAGGKKILECDVDKIKETKNINLSEIVKSSEIIRLSNDSIALVGQTWLAAYSNDHIFLANFQNQLYLFDIKGNFIRSWQPGRGPNEFIRPSNPQIVNQHAYLKDEVNQKFIEYDLENNLAKNIQLIKKSGKSVVLDDSEILSIGNSESSDDPFLICLQDFNKNILASKKASSQFKIEPPLVQEAVVFYPFHNTWKIHLPANDTLMQWDSANNTIEPEAIFYSKSHVLSNRKLDEARKEHGLNITDKELTQTVRVVPEFETKRFYFLSVFFYGQDKNLPWYFANRKICLVEKETMKAYYVKITDDFWGNTEFSPNGNSMFWSNVILKNKAAISVKKKFEELLKNHDKTMNDTMKAKINKVLSEINENDNNLIFKYNLKE